jgi:uncharacterized protein (TIGR03067 family)
MTQRLAAIAVLGVLALATASARADDLEKIQGVWDAEKAALFGKELPAEEAAKMSVEIKGNKAKLRNGDGNEVPIELTLDGSKSPKTIDLKKADGKSSPGIYEFDGNTLKICFPIYGDVRPTKFEAPAESAFLYIVFKKKAK